MHAAQYVGFSACPSACLPVCSGYLVEIDLVDNNKIMQGHATSCNVVECS